MHKGENLYDKNGTPIEVGDVLKVFHYIAALRRKRCYMYKQAIAVVSFSSQAEYIKFSHLDMTEQFYVERRDGRVLPDYEIIQSAKCNHESRPKSALTTKGGDDGR